jgi:pilus assembly protein CpaD
MSDFISNGLRRSKKTAGLLATVTLAVLASACANTDSIVVGSVPDDYRTNHPIVVSERAKTIDVPVGMNDHQPGRVQLSILDSFMADYDHHSKPLVTMLVPSGSGNQLAAGNVAGGLAKRMESAGVARGRIIVQHYDASRYGETAPIRLSYTAMRASTASQCGRWPDNMLNNNDNKHWANFGCSYQNNLAAQIANPADLLGPRRRTEIDAENRSAAIDRWREQGGTFVGPSEIAY